MTHAHLLDELADRLLKATAQVRLPMETGEVVSVNVYEGYLPEDAYEDTSYLPFVLMEYLGTHDDLGGDSTATIGLAIGIYSPEADAWHDALHLMEIIRLDLLQRRVIAKRFRLTDLKWETPDSQPRPFYYVLGELSFDVYQAEELRAINMVCTCRRSRRV